MIAFGTITVSGCGNTDSDGPVTLTVYVSAPLSGPRAREGLAIHRGARLALERAGGRVGDLRIRARYLDDTGGSGRWSQAATAANARRAAQDSTAIGYVGDLDSGASRVSLPITNQAEIPQVSPASTAEDLTRGVPGEPDPSIYRPSGDQTFARVVPGDDVQATAAAGLARRLGARRAIAVSGRSSYGRSLAAAFAAKARGLGIPTRVDADPQPDLAPPGGSRPGTPTPSIAASPASVAYFYAGASPVELRATDRSAAGPVISTDATLPFIAAVCRSLPAPSPQLVTSSFLAPSMLALGRVPFLAEYRSRWGSPPASAAYGFEAMSLLLESIRAAGGSGEDRGAVIEQLLSGRARRSLLGEYSIEPGGNTTLRRLSVYRLRRCAPTLDG